MEPINRWLTTKEAAEYLGYSTHSLKVSRMYGKLGGKECPKYRKAGTAVRYSQDDLDRWILGEQEDNASLDNGE